MTAICVVCEAPLPPNPKRKRNRRYCSRTCSQAANVARRRAKRTAALAAVAAEFGTTWRNGYREEDPRDCDFCGKALPLYRHHSQVYCNKDCANGYFRKLESEARAEARARAEPNAECEHCGRAYRKTRRDHKFCSRRCYGAAARASKGR